MQRRAFIQSGLAVAAAPFLSVATPGSAVAASRGNTPDWTLGWRNVDTDYLAPKRLRVDGKLPAALRGVLFRNGPARQERAGVRYQHWFDGDGMIQRFRLDADGIVHDGRFVQTEKYREEQAAGEFLYSGAGTALPTSRGARNNDTANVANTALLPWNDELLALWEGGSAYRVNPANLETLGRKDWRDDLKHMPFSAHPLQEQDGTLWNFGSAPYAGKNGTLFVYRIAATGEILAAKPVALPMAGYLHSFTMTARHLVFYIGPHVFERGGKTFVDSFQWRPDQGSRILVIDKNDLTAQRWFEAPAGFTFHCGNAYETGNDIVAQLCLYQDAGVMQSGMFDLMAGAAQSGAYPDYARARLATLRLSLAEGTARVESTDELLEFPGVDPRSANTATPVFGVGHRHPETATFADTVVRIDPSTGRRDRYTFSDHHIVEEPLFVAVPGAKAGAGWLVGTFLDLGRQQSGVYVLDAERLATGPIALASMDRALPLGFHGCYVPASS